METYIKWALFFLILVPIIVYLIFYFAPFEQSVGF